MQDLDPSSRGVASRLDLLLADYAQAREDERHATGQHVAILAATLAAGVGIVVLMWESQPSAGEPSGVVFWVGVLSPIILLVPIVYAAVLGSESTIRSFYIRILEHELQKELAEESNPRITPLSSGFATSTPTLRPFSLKELQTLRTTMGRVPSEGFLLLAIIVVAFGATFLLLVAQAYLRLMTISDVFAAGFVVSHLACAFLLGKLIVQTSLGGRRYFEEAVSMSNRNFNASRLKGVEWKRHSQGLPGLPVLQTGKPSISGLVARQDELVKIVYELFGTASALFLLHRSGLDRPVDERFLMLLLGILTFEILVYRTRYVVNDLLGAHEEANLRSKDHRQRLKTEYSHIVTAVRSLLIRSAAILALVCCTLAAQVGLSIALGSLAVVVLTAAYESCRWVQASAKPASKLQRIAVYSTFILVALGNPLRFLVGFCLCVELSVQSPQHAVSVIASWSEFLIWALVWCCAHSACSVMTTWVLEGLFEARSYSIDSLQFDWRAEGKRHVWTVLNRFLATLGVRAWDSEEWLKCRLVNRELSGNECWAIVSSKKRSVWRRLGGWVIAPWTVGALLGGVASVVLIAALFGVDPPVCRVVAGLTFYAIAFMLAHDAIIVGRSSAAASAVTMLLPVPVVWAISTFPLQFGDILIAVLLGYFLTLFSGPAWISQLRGKYSSTRNILATLMQKVAWIDRWIALWIVVRKPERGIAL